MLFRSIFIDKSLSCSFDDLIICLILLYGKLTYRQRIEIIRYDALGENALEVLSDMGSTPIISTIKDRIESSQSGLFIAKKYLYDRYWT